MSHFLNYIHDRIRKNKNFIAAITGGTGSGKSYSALKMGELLDPDFDIRNLCFTPKELMDLVEGKTKELKAGSCIIFDEIQVSMSHLNFQDVVSKCLNFLFQTFRHRNFILIMTSPHFDLINASLRKLFHSRIETIYINPKSKQCCLKPLLLQINQRSGKVYNKYLRVNGTPLTQLKVGLASSELLKQYEDRKDQFTKNLNKEIREKIKASEMKKKRKKGSMDFVLRDWEAGISTRKTALRLGISQQMVFRYRQKLRDVGYKPKISKKKGVIKTKH